MNNLKFWQKLDVISNSLFSFCFGTMSFFALLFFIALMVKALVE